MEETTQTNNSQPVTPSQTPLSSRNLIPIVVVAVIAAILASLGTYFVMSSNQNKQSQMSNVQPTTTQASPTQTVTEPMINTQEGWKTYAKANSWEIQYPSAWHVFEDNTAAIGFSDGKDVPRGPDVGQIYVQVASGNTSTSYDTLLAKQVGAVEKGSKLTVTTLEKLTVDGYPAVKQLEETTPGAATEPSYEVAVYVKGPTNVRISASALRYKNDGYTMSSFESEVLASFEQMVKSFTFSK